jgi:hypothetical protein
MKRLPLAALMVGFAVGIAPAFAQTSRTTPRLNSQIQAEYRYDQETTANRLPRLPADDDVVQMEAFTVTEAIVRRDLERKLAAMAAAREAEKFKPLTGGRISTHQIGRVVADTGFWPIIEEREIKYAGGQDILLRVDLLRLKW